jgi:type II secretory pathway pseudopilin PulG
MRFIHRPAATLIELLIYLGVLSMIVAVALPMFFSATENRLLQQTISIVEQNGTQMLQNASLHIRNAERIISPAAGQTGSVLVLQTSSGSTDPTIIGISSGTLVIIEHATKQPVSSPQVAIQNFVVRNTSVSATRPSVRITFTLSRTIRLQLPHSYVRSFDATVSLLPDDIASGNSCGCLPPTCDGNDMYTWRVCEEATCYAATTSLECP